MKIRGYAQSDIGQVRLLNEDSFYVNEQHDLWIIADGMGGHDSGEVASKLACTEIAEYVENGHTVVEAIKHAHNSIKSAPWVREVGTFGMGTTVIAAKLTDEKFEISWVGDSRAYLFTHTKLYQLSKDHSYVQDLVDAGMISEAQAEHHPGRHIITQSLGSLLLEEIDVGSTFGKLCKDEKILMCSDGLTTELSDEEIFNIVNASKNSIQALETLVKNANDKGGSDNITIILIDAPENSEPRINDEDFRC